MASKSDSSRPSSRRTSSHPKSSRQQFSACGACRMRRVRCDLKDLQAANPSAGLPACSNCQERGLKCVDEFAEVKAVKLLRRGRRLQQVEAVYGKSAIDDDRRYVPLGAGVPQCIPRLRPEFFSSPFFHAFLTQRPIIDPFEFSYRFLKAQDGNLTALGSTGQLICLVLSVWAASFGINEAGEPEPHAGMQATRIRKERTNMMAQELLQLIDAHGLLRKPSWDGVRVLLLMIPLTEDVQSPMERLAMYEAAVNQVYTLCSLANVTTVNSGQGEYIDAAVRARIFWYAHVHEGITTGLRGGRLLLSEDDLDAFQATLPSIPPVDAHISQPVAVFSYAYRYSKIPIRLSMICRQVHACLTGPKARQSNSIDASRLHEAWSDLANAWEALDALRQFGTDDFLQPQEVERFIDGWQILIFECFNVIRESLKQRLVGCSGAVDTTFLSDGTVSRSPRFTQVAQLHTIAEARCRQYARLVVAIARRHLNSSFFEFDASLVRDGCFFAGVLLAGESGTEEEVSVCLQALRSMRWAFSKSVEREHTLNMVWEQRMASEGLRREDGVLRRRDFSQSSGPSSFTSSIPSENRLRHPPPPLLIAHATDTLHGSAPNTAVTEDGWTMISKMSPYGPHSHRSSSGSPPFVHTQKADAIETALMLAPPVNDPLYYQQTMTDMDTFAYSIVPNTSGSPPRSPHDFTPPRSSTGMSSSSASYPDNNSGYFDSTGTPLFTVSPPGSARGAVDGTPNGSLPLDKPYRTNYNAGQFYVAP
ncbi:hypothetical protein ACEPAI_5101 [Sanghuangporus weigelae]